MKILLSILILSVSFCPVSAQTKFIWPIKVMPSYSEINNFYTVNNFVDQNPTSDTLDWNCRKRSYNLHTGVDIDLWPFTWSMMDNNYVAVVAAAPGVVAQVVDNNNNENNCSPPGNPPANFIRIRHADGSNSVYVHIRDNSAQVVLNQIVAAGDIIAFVGSSGNTSNPHLHFEVHGTDVVGYGSQVNLIDPYSGSCNSLNANSWWLDQKPYWEPAILRVMTHSTPPVQIGFNQQGLCKSAEFKNDKAAFAPNDSIYFGVAMRDYLQGQSFSLSVYDPNGVPVLGFSETNTSTNDTSTAGRYRGQSYYIFSKQLPPNSISGTYKVEVSFNGTTGVHFFSVNCPATQNVTGTMIGYRGFKAATSITSSASMDAGNRLLLQAGSTITLSPGFSAKGGSVLKARIKDCNYSE